MKKTKEKRGETSGYAEQDEEQRSEQQRTEELLPGTHITSGSRFRTPYFHDQESTENAATGSGWSRKAKSKSENRTGSCSVIR
ncbi:MAG: hypothetical protein ACLTSZ_14805 [Lachnospiraceae bacterium]